MAVYFIRVVGTDCVKIGRAVDVKSRLATMTTDNYQDLELCLTIKPYIGLDEHLEKEFHERFADRRIKREWFNLPLLVLVQVLKEQYMPRSFDHDRGLRTITHYTIENYLPDEIEFDSCVEGITDRCFTQEELRMRFPLKATPALKSESNSHLKVG